LYNIKLISRESKEVIEDLILINFIFTSKLFEFKLFFI
jgi:hypothetical protein